jgi:hypothetical protein
LIETIKTWNLPKGTENSLTSKLQNAIQSLENEQQNAAINKLNAFINEVKAQRGKKLTNGQATSLVGWGKVLSRFLKLFLSVFLALSILP